MTAKRAFVKRVDYQNQMDLKKNDGRNVFLSATELKFRADYNSTPCGVGVVVVVRVHFKNGITFERFEISA